MSHKWFLVVLLSTASAAVAVPAAAEDENSTIEREQIVIEDGKTVEIEYTLKLDDGTVVDSNVGSEPLSYEQGAHQILPALEDALEGLKADEMKKVSLTAAEGYGEVNPEAFHEVSPDVVPEEARVPGQSLVGQDAQGNQFRVRVHEVTAEKIVLDFNHPLAGKNLNFDVRVVSIK